MPSQWIQTLIDLPPLWDVLLKVSAVLAVGWGLHFLLLNRNPRWRALLWRAVAVGVLTIPLIVLILPALKVPVASPPVAATSAFEVVSPPLLAVLPPVAASQPTGFEAARRNPGAMALIVWTLVTLLLAIRVVRASWRVQRMVKTSTVVPQHAQVLLKQVAADLGCPYEVKLRQSKEISSPFLCGLRRPLMILPERMPQPDYAAELPAIFAHELAHLRTHDLWWMGAVQWLQALLWFHPLAWRMRTAHAAACEEICDAVAADYVGDGVSYSRTLSRVALELVAMPPVVGGIPMARVSAIRHRLELLKEKVYSSPLPLRWAMLAILVGSLVLAGVASLRFVYAEASDSSAPESVEELDTIVPRLSLSNIEIREFLILLSRQSGLNITVSKEVKGLVTLEVSNISVRDALDVVLKDSGWNYIVTPGGIVRVMTQEQYERERSGSTSVSISPGQWDLKGRSLKELDTVVPSIRVNNIDIKEFLILLSKYSGLNFTMSKGVEGPVTVELSNISVRDVLDVVLKDNGWDYITTPSGIVRVITQKQYEKETAGQEAALLPHGLEDVQVEGLDRLIPGQLSVTNIDIGETLDLLGRYSGLRFTITRAVKGPVTLELSDVSVRQVLDLLAEPLDLRYGVSPNGVIQVMSQGEYPQTAHPSGFLPREYPAENISLEELDALLRPLLSEEGSLVVDEESRKITAFDNFEATGKMERAYDHTQLRPVTLRLPLDVAEEDLGALREQLEREGVEYEFQTFERGQTLTLTGKGDVRQRFSERVSQIVREHIGGHAVDRASSSEPTPTPGAESPDFAPWKVKMIIGRFVSFVDETGKMVHKEEGDEHFGCLIKEVNGGKGYIVVESLEDPLGRTRKIMKEGIRTR